MSHDNFLEKGFEPALVLHKKTNWWCPAIVNPLSTIQIRGDTLVSGSYDKVVKIWDLSSGICKNTLFGHSGPVRCARFNSETVISGGDDKLIKFWALFDGRCLKTLTGHTERVCSLQFDDTKLVSSSQDQSIRIWDLEGRELSVLAGEDKNGHTGSVWCVHFTTGDEQLASGSADATVKLWDIERGTCVNTLPGHRLAIASVHMNSREVVSASLDKTLRLWDRRTGEHVRTFEGHEDMVGCVQMDESKVISGSADENVRIWDKSSEKSITKLIVDSSVACLHFDDGKLAVGTRSSLRVMDYGRSK